MRHRLSRDSSRSSITSSKGSTTTSRAGRVLLEVQERAYVGEFRAENEWPLARTTPKQSFLDARAGALALDETAEEASIGYNAQTGLVSFNHRVDARTELIGKMKLRLWVEAEAPTTEISSYREARQSRAARPFRDR